MANTVFFSWQSDTPNANCRNFVEKALAKAIDQLAEDMTIDEAIRGGLTVDKDTKGVPGTPPIVDTIFRKIDAAAAFLADVTFVGTRLDGRPTPNPNVLLEYGWALKTHGYSRIMCVMNTHYGEPNDETLPFNMKHLRWPIQYLLPDDAEAATRQAVLSQLASKFAHALRDLVQSDDFQQSTPPPPGPLKFEAAPSLDGPARFRKRGEELGLMELGLNRFHGQRGTPVQLAEGSALWVRVMPDERLGRQWSISDLRDVLSKPGMILTPVGPGTSWAYVRGADGFGYVTHPPRDNTRVISVSFVFKSGEVWTTFAGPVGTQDTFINVERMVTGWFLHCIHFMHEGLKIALPYRWNAGIEGVKGKRMQRFAPPGESYVTPYTTECMLDLVSETGVLKDGDEARLALTPFFQRLYDACGDERGEHMDRALLAL